SFSVSAFSKSIKALKKDTEADQVLKSFAVKSLPQICCRYSFTWLLFIIFFSPLASIYLNNVHPGSSSQRLTNLINFLFRKDTLCAIPFLPIYSMLNLSLYIFMCLFLRVVKP